MIKLRLRRFRDQLMICLSIIAIMMVDTLFAQSTDSGVAALTQAVEEIKRYVPITQYIVYSIGGLTGIIGSFIAGWKITQGDQDASKSAMMLVGGCIFIILLVAAIPTFFGL